MDLTKVAAYSDKTPYDLWQEAEGIPIVRGHCVEDLAPIPVAPWQRAGVLGSFVQLVGAGRTPPGHVHVVLETARALGIAEDEIFLSPMLAEFRAKIDFKRSILWEGTIAEFHAAGATEEQTGYWSADFFKALTAHYDLTAEQAIYFSTHEEADLKEHADGVMGHGSFRRLVLQRLLEDGMADVRPGYSLEYCGLTAVDLHGVILQAALDAAAQQK